MKSSLILFCMCLSMTVICQTVDNNIQNISGQWTGKLTYTDYQDDISQTTLKCLMKTQWKGKKGMINIGFEEPNGKIYYSKSKFKILKGGKAVKFEGSTYAVELFKIDVQTKFWTLVMLREGKDNRKLAAIKQTIIFDGKMLSLIKEVKYKESENYFLRNKYSFKRRE